MHGLEGRWSAAQADPETPSPTGFKKRVSGGGCNRDPDRRVGSRKCRITTTADDERTGKPGSEAGPETGLKPVFVVDLTWER